MDRLKVVICGGGVAGLEGLLRLRRLAGDRVELVLVSPDDEFRYRPLAVQEPFSVGRVRRYPMRRIACDAGADWIKDRAVRVDTPGSVVWTEGGRAIAYDALLLAIGARETSPFAHAHVFSDRDGGQRFRAIVRDIDYGRVGSVAFVLPDGPTWPLPLYELALMTASRARSLSADVRLVFLTPEVTPLMAFGPQADEAMLRLLAEAGIELHSGVRVQVPAPGQVMFHGTAVSADRIVTLPRITPFALAGVPSGMRWFVPVDARCRVRDVEGHVFAAGDVTDVLVKHGGVGAQQADTAAAAIAHLAGATEHPPPALEPVIRGMLLTGDRPLYLAARLTATRGVHSEIFEHPPWPEAEKIVAAELGPYLVGLDAEGAAAAASRPAAT